MTKLVELLTKLEDWIISILPKFVKDKKLEKDFTTGIKLAIPFTLLFSIGYALGVNYNHWLRYEKGGAFGWLYENGKIKIFGNVNYFSWDNFWVITVGGLIGGLIRFFLISLVRFLIF